MAKSRVSAKVRAAVLAELQAGEQPAVVAAKYGLDAAQVRVWKQRYVTVADSSVTPVTPLQRPSLEAQQYEIGAVVLELLAAKLKASKAIAEAATSDREWLRKQSASELAAFGAWLDSTAFAIGDRLAGRSERDEPPADDA